MQSGHPGPIDNAVKNYVSAAAVNLCDETWFEESFKQIRREHERRGVGSGMKQQFANVMPPEPSTERAFATCEYHRPLVVG